MKLAVNKMERAQVRNDVSLSVLISLLGSSMFGSNNERRMAYIHGAEEHIIFNINTVTLPLKFTFVPVYKKGKGSTRYSFNQETDLQSASA
jgi:hypothetical protein